MWRFLYLIIVFLWNYSVVLSQVPTNGLVAYYPFNGNANDESGNGNNGVVDGAILTTDRFGNAAKAYSFNGVSQKITITDAPLLNFSSSFSISYWLKASSWGDYTKGGIISKKANDAANGYVIYNDGRYSERLNKVNFRLGGQTYYFSESTVETKKWQHWVITYDAENSCIRIFKNGALDITYYYSVGDLTSNTNLYLGFAETWNSYLDGALDDVRFYRRTLSLVEVGSLYKSESPTIDTHNGLIAYYPFNGNTNDESGNGNHGVRTGLQLTSDRNNQANKAYAFNGNSLITVSPSISLNSIQEDSDISLSVWFYPNEWNKNGVFINKSGPADMHYRFYSTESGLVLQVGSFAWSVGYTMPDEEVWHHLAASKSGNSVTFYYNGQILGTATPFNTGNTFNKNFPLEIGRDAHGPTEWSNGKLDEVRIYNRGLASSEILAIYNDESPACENTSPNIISVNVASQTDVAGLLKITADAQVCPDNNPIVKFKYWFNEDINNAKTNLTNKSTYLHYPIELSSLDLKEGEHVINLQFITENESASAIISKPFTRIPVTLGKPGEPLFVSVNPGKINAGDNIIIRGTGFVPNGLASLIIYGNNNEGILFEGDIAIDNLGKFEIQEVVKSNSITGQYTVVANDQNSNKISESIIFINGINKINDNPLRLIEPLNTSEVSLGTSVRISWEGFVENEEFLNNTALVPVNYTIEVSFNKGSWETISNYSTFKTRIPSNYMQFAINYILANSGSYKFRITDPKKSGIFVETPAISTIENSTLPITVNYHWDKSGNYAKPMPLKGVVADGTARFLIEIRTPASTPVSNVKIELFDDKGTTELPQYLGKVYPASVTEFSAYSEEANDAKETSATQINASNPEKTKWYFWYVAPDDFLRPNDSRESSERKVGFSVSLNNNPPILGKYIDIVRPPLMMVHGLGGDAIKTWEYTRFNGNSGNFYFSNAHALFKAGVVRPSMHPTDCFVKNAKRLLNMIDNDCDANNINQSISIQPNSLISVIAQSISKGYACSRVDYVCHSMGGVMIRAAINGYEKFYLANSQSPSNFKNYGKGFVNKLITINTPHWGSPWADMADDIIKDTYQPFSQKLIENEKVLEKLFDSKDNYFIERYAEYGGGYKINNAIKDLQYYDGGVTLSETKIKNHIIYGRLGHLEFFPTEQLLYLFQGPLRNVVRLHKDYIPYDPLLFNLEKVLPETLAFEMQINRIFQKNYTPNNSEFIANSDLIVSVNSQLSGGKDRPVNSISRFNGGSAKHTGTVKLFWPIRIIESIVSNDKVGDRVLDILNSPIASDVFADKLDANPNNKGISRLSKGNESVSVKAKGAVILSGTKLQIDAPLSNDSFSGDSIFSVQASINDTIGLRYLRLYFQGAFYYSSSKVFNHTFSLPIRPNLNERELIYLTGVYDSAGTVAYHTDTVGIIITGTPILTGISAFLDRSFISKGDTIIPFVDAITDRGVIRLSRLDSLVSISILDTSIAKVSVLGNKIVVHSRRGSTRAVVTYNGFTDTLVLAHNDIDENLIQPTYCLGSENILVARLNGAVNRQWQIDQGSGFENIVNDSRFDGVISDTLVIISADSSLFGKKIRCITSIGGNEISSQVFIIRFVNKWIGAISDDWHESGNWSCGNVPNKYSDVIISTKSIFLPRIRLNASVNSLELEDSAVLNIDEGINLEILSKEVNY